MAVRDNAWQAAGRVPRLRHGASALRCLLVGLAVLLAGCAQLVPQTIGLRSDWPADVPRTLELRAVPFFPQVAYQCGPAALAMVMGVAGASVVPDDLVDQVYLPARQGSLQVEMLAAPRRHGVVGWQLPTNFDALLRELAAGHPVLVLQNVGPWPFDNWHYAVVVGFDYPSGTLFLRSGTTERLALPFTVFELTWRRSGYWAMVVTAPGTLPATAAEASSVQTLLAFERVAGADASRRAWEALHRRWPGNALGGVALGNRYYAAGELGRAEATWRRAAQHHPDSPAILNNLAQVLSDLGRDDEALHVIERASQHQGAFGAEVDATRSAILKRLRR